MSQNTIMINDAHHLPLPLFPTRKSADAYLHKTPKLWDSFLKLPGAMQQELIDFCMGKCGLKVTYDTVFKKIYDVKKKSGIKRLNALLSAVTAFPLPELTVTLLMSSCASM